MRTAISNMRASVRSSEIARPSRWADGSQPGFPIATELWDGTHSVDADARLVGLTQGGMRLNTAYRPGLGQRVLARFVLRGRPLGCAAGFVTQSTPRRGVTIGFHHVSDRMRELIQDACRLRPSLRAGFLTELVDAHIDIS